MRNILIIALLLIASQSMAHPPTHSASGTTSEYTSCGNARTKAHSEMNIYKIMNLKDTYASYRIGSWEISDCISRPSSWKEDSTGKITQILKYWYKVKWKATYTLDNYSHDPKTHRHSRW